MPFIVLEGLDGAGKSTQLKFLTEMISRSGLRCEYLHFPRFDAPFYGKLIARFLRGEFGDVDQVDPYIVALLFAGDRADAAPQIRKWLEEGTVVVTDRYVNSNIAFQCAKYESHEDRRKLADWINGLEFGHNALPLPDISIFLDVPFAFTESRLTEQRSGEDRDYLNGLVDIHEQSLDLQRRVREVYLDCASTDAGLKVVDCSDGNGHMDTPENNFRKIAHLLEPILQL